MHERVRILLHTPTRDWRNGLLAGLPDRCVSTHSHRTGYFVDTQQTHRQGNYRVPVALGRHTRGVAISDQENTCVVSKNENEKTSLQLPRG